MNKEELIYKKDKEGFYNLLLMIGNWKRNFAVYETKVIISHALTECIKQYSQTFELKGYLITDKRLFLMIFCDSEKELKFILNDFKEKVQKRIIAFSEIEFQTEDTNTFHQPVITKEFHLKSSLFKEHHLINENIIMLLLGKKITSKYYNQNLERIKKQINNNPYCSALEYNGGESAVDMRLPDYKKEKNSRENVTEIKIDKEPEKKNQ